MLPAPHVSLIWISDLADMIMHAVKQLKKQFLVSFANLAIEKMK